MSRSPQYYQYINSSKWREKSRRCQSLTKKHCIIFPQVKSHHCHHLTYRNFQKEIPLRDTVPLCKFAHRIIHWWIFWKTPLRPGINFLLRILMAFWVVAWFILPSEKPKNMRKLLH